MRPNLIIIVTILLLVWLTPATARTYRWVDENGVTIYSQSPPPSGIAAKVIKPPPPPSNPPDETMKKLKARLDAIDEDKKKKTASKEKEQKEEKSAEIKKRNCENAKKDLGSLELHPRIKMKMDDGNYKMLTDEERTAEIEKAKKAIEQNCN